MELIVRTAHGTADVSVDVHDRDITLRDVITSVTGQAAPDTARVDGRLVNAGDTLNSCGVVTGAVVDTLLNDRSGSEDAPAAVLRQLTGPGAGRHVPLGHGTYRIGPGRRHQADELSSDAPDLVAFEIEVNGAGVTVSPPRQKSSPVPVSPLTLSGRPLEGPQQWTDGPLVAAGRIFRLDDQLPVERPAPTTSPDGYVAHNRPPGVLDTARTIAEAVDHAQARAPQLWHRRTTNGPIRVDIGLTIVDSAASPTSSGVNGLAPMTLEFDAGSVVVVAGEAHDRNAAARSILIDSCTRYGPADLDIVVASPPSNLDQWDWAKWLPHIRWGASVDLLTNDLEMASFLERPLARSTIVIVTADELWNTATSPLRSVVVDGMQHATVLVLTESHSTAPSNTTTLVALDAERPGRASVTHLGDAAQDTAHDTADIDVFVPLLDTDVAGAVARHLAPLVDADRVGDTTPVSHHIPLGKIVQVDAASRRWNSALGAPGNPVQMAVGTVAEVMVGVDFAIDASVAISGSSIDEAVDVATVLTLSIASTWSPTEATLLLVDHRATPATNPTQGLPHHGGTFSERDAASINRLLTRLADELGGDNPSGTRLVVIVNGLAETELAAPGLVAGLSALAANSLGMHLVIATARPLAVLPTELRDLCVLEIAVDGYGGTRRATLQDRRRQLQTPFTPYDESTTTADALTVRPFVFGRRPSALERRLERGGHQAADTRDSVVARLVRQLSDLADDIGSDLPRPLLPIALPSRVIAAELWSGHTGDGVPLGVLDSADADPASTTSGLDWWLPGLGGSRLLIGSPRSGVRSTLEVLLVGVADRFAVADIEVIVVEQNDRRRTLMADVPHVTAAVSPEHDGAVEAALADVARSMHERATNADFRLHDHPTLLVLVRDVERLTEPARAALAHLLAEGAGVGVNVVASMARPEGVESMIAVARRLVVGSLSDTNHYALLGAERSPSVERNVGRAQLIESSAPIGVRADRTTRLVQLAELGASFDSVLDALVTIMKEEP